MKEWEAGRENGVAAEKKYTGNNAGVFLYFREYGINVHFKNLPSFLLVLTLFLTPVKSRSLIGAGDYGFVFVAVALADFIGFRLVVLFRFHFNV